MRKLNARTTAYSSIVGGGITLREVNRAVFLLNIIGVSQGVTQKEATEITTRISELINEHGLEISPRPDIAG